MGIAPLTKFLRELSAISARATGALADLSRTFSIIYSLWLYLTKASRVLRALDTLGAPSALFARDLAYLKAIDRALEKGVSREDLL